jgi:hypothetical protein
MRKTLFWLVSTLLFVLPAAAQRGQARGQQHQQHQTFGVRQQGNGERPNVGVRQRGNDRHEDRRDDRRGNFPQRDDRTFTSREHEFHADHEMRGYHWGRGRGEMRNHWDGRRFDRDYWGRHWGYGHRFYWNHCEWYGPRFYPGSYFWYGGVYFVVIEPVPDYWYDEEVYVDYIDGYGYALINPMYPGVYYHIDIRF